MEFNKYLYYFMCLVADTIYLMWISYCMFSSKLIRNIAFFIISYIALTALLCIAYFYLGDVYTKDLGLEVSNAAQWSRYDLISIFSGVGVFMAPIAVLIGFNAWKKQQFESSKIRVIEELKTVLTKQNDLLKDFRLNDLVILINICEFSQFNEKKEKFMKKFENYRSEISFILQKDSFYFELGSKQHSKLYDLNNNTIEIMTNLEQASDDLISYRTTKELNNIRGRNVENVEEALNKRRYLLQPMYMALPFKIDKTKKDLEKQCIEFEKDQIYKYLDEFFDYLNELLKEAYEQ